MFSPYAVHLILICICVEKAFINVSKIKLISIFSHKFIYCLHRKSWMHFKLIIAIHLKEHTHRQLCVCFLHI